MRAAASGAGRGAAFAAVLAAAAIMAGCATTSGGAPAGPVGPVGGGPDRARLYAEAVAAARQATASGRLREALWRWRVAEAVAPDRAAAAREADTAQARLAAAADAADAEGARAARAGRASEAQVAYGRALELDPQRPQARAYMREVLARQVMSDVSRLAGSEPKAGRKAKAAKAARRPRPAKG